MWFAGYTPKTILNIGLGTAPEVPVWQWLYPNAQIIGADIRLGKSGSIGNVHVFKTLIGDGTKEEVEYCWKCHSTKCPKPEHKIPRLSTLVPMMTVDELVKIRTVEPPYFLWIDVDGSELEVLRGATNTLQLTDWVNIEVVNYGTVQNNAADVHEWMLANDYELILCHSKTQDRLYHRKVC
jgi:FkbM family methyltransferase